MSVFAQTGRAATADCKPPAWTRVVDVRRGPGEATGVGKGATVDLARREARRQIATKVVPKHVAELVQLPSLKGKLNRKAYAPEDLTRALTLAVAYDLGAARVLESGVVCATTYVALAMKEKAVLDAAGADSDLADHVNLALTNQLDALEAKRDAGAQAARAKEKADALATPEATVQRLRQGADALDADDLLEGLLAAALRQRATALADQVEALARQPWNAKRAKAAQAVEDRALEEAKYLAATEEVRKKSYVSAREMLTAHASAGDATAQFAVGYMAAQALGMRRDYPEALTWLKRAASQNFGPAKALIGLLVLSGHAGKPSADQAAKWLGSALDDGWTCEAELTQCRLRAAAPTTE